MNLGFVARFVAVGIFYSSFASARGAAAQDLLTEAFSRDEGHDAEVRLRLQRTAFLTDRASVADARWLDARRRRLRRASLGLLPLALTGVVGAYANVSFDWTWCDTPDAIDCGSSTTSDGDRERRLVAFGVLAGVTAVPMMAVSFAGLARRRQLRRLLRDAGLPNDDETRRLYLSAFVAPSSHALQLTLHGAF